MPTAEVDGLSIAYEVIGEGGPTWAITPGGRFSKDYGGVREMAQALAVGGRRVVIWDRPNCGASDLAFRGSSESDVQADALAGLLRCLELAPAVIIGGSGGSRVSLLTVAHHPDVASGLAVWWISGGPFGLLSLAMHYCGNSISAAWREGMEAVAALPEWQESLERNPRNRQRLLEQDRREFISTLERWMLAYCPSDDEVVPGLARSEAARITVPTLVFRSGTTDVHHTRATSEDVAQAIPTAELVDPPWGDNEWNERGTSGESLFVRWPLLVPQLQEWAGKALGA